MSCADPLAGCHADITPATGLRRSRLDRRLGDRLPSERPLELVARADFELAEHLVEVIFDAARADEQPGADLRVGEPLAGEPRDLRVLRRETFLASDGPSGDSLTRGRQLALGAAGGSLDPHRREHGACRPKLVAALRPAALGVQPLPADEMRAGELDADACAPQAFDRVSVEALGDLSVAEQRS
jgi:hypothetical protein